MRFIAFFSGFINFNGASERNCYHIYNMAYLSLYLIDVSYFVLDFAKNNYSLSIEITIVKHKAIIIIK